MKVYCNLVLSFVASFFLSCLFVLVVHQTLNASESVCLLVYALALACGSLEELFGFAASSSSSFASSRDGCDGGGEHGEVSRLLLLRGK